MKPIPAASPRKIAQHIAVGGADGFHQADLAGAFENGHGHRVGDTDRGDQQGDRAHAAEDNLHNHVEVVDALHVRLWREGLEAHRRQFAR